MAEKKDYSRLKELLELQEKFPLEFTHKFIGKSTPAFEKGIEELEKKFPGIRQVSKRASGNGGHLALTYALTADSADRVVELFRETDQIPDLLFIL